MTNEAILKWAASLSDDEARQYAADYKKDPTDEVAKDGYDEYARRIWDGRIKVTQVKIRCPKHQNGNKSRRCNDCRTLNRLPLVKEQ